MTDRSIRVKLDAEVQGYVQGFRRAEQATQDLAKRLDITEQEAERAQKAMAAQARKAARDQKQAADEAAQHLNRLSNGAALVGTGLLAGVGVAVKSAADFDEAMSQVAATGSDARASFDQLRDAALQAGADTKYSATEAAGGVEALAKAGVSAQDTLGGGLSGALSLAAAGNLDVAGSAEAAASAMNQFGLSGGDIPHIADLLAQAAGTAQGEVSDMAAALNQSGLVASQFGLSIDETAESLALFAKNGLVGSDSGTSFKTMLTSLYAPAGAGAKALDSLGLSAYDAAGSLKPIGVLTDDLKAKLDGLSEQDRNKVMRDIFGSDAIRAGSILLREGSAGLTQMATDFGKFGSASDVARIKMNNLKGDLEQFRGSVETALIGTGEGAQGVLRGLTQHATETVNSFNTLQASSKQATLAAGAIGGGALLGAAGIGKLLVSAADAREAVDSLSTTFPRGTKAAAGLGKALGVAGAAVGGFMVAAQVGNQFIEGPLITGLDDATGAVLKLAQTADLASLDGFFTTDKAQAFTNGSHDLVEGVDDVGSAIERTFHKNWQERFSDFGASLLSFTGAQSEMDSLSASFRQIDTSLSSLTAGGKATQAAKSFDQIRAAAAAQGVSTEQLLSLFPQYEAALKKQANDLGVTTLSAQDYADWMGGKVPAAITAAAGASGGLKTGLKGAKSGLDGVATSAEDAAAKLNDLVDAAQANAKTLLALSGSNIGMEDAIDAATAAAKENGKTLDVNTEKGRANQQALNSLATATGEYAKSLITSKASAEEVVAANERGKASFIATAESMGKSKSAARALADQLFTLPKNVTSQVVVAGAGVSKKQAHELNVEIQKLPEETRARIVTIANTEGAHAAQEAIEHVRDKTVIARSKGDLSGAKAVDRAMRALRDRLVAARTRGDTSGARAIQAAMNALHDKTVTLTTINRTVVQQYGRNAKQVGKAYGGLIPGYSPDPRADNIPVMATAGEFMQDRPAVDFWGLGFMEAVLDRNIELVKRQLSPFANGSLALGHGGLVSQERSVITHNYVPSASYGSAALAAAAVREPVNVEQHNTITQPEDPRIIAAQLGRQLQVALSSS